MAVINQRKLRQMLREGDRATSTTAKGKALEDAVLYAFERLPGVSIYQRNVLDHFGCSETDLIFSNRTHENNLGFLDWGLIVECKNLARSVGAADVTYFRTRLEAKAAQTGVLVAAGGIAGTPGLNAFRAIEDALTHGREILVLTRPDLESFRTSDDLAALLFRRYMDLKTSGTLILD